jgi:hypothetical protein
VDERLLALYLRHVGMGFDRQLRLGEYLQQNAEGQEWGYTTSTATLTFGSNVRFEAHDLGSHADPDNSWLWVWNNPHLQLTPANHELAKAVRLLGSKTGIKVFSAKRQFDLGPLLGDLSEHAAHVFGMVLGGELGYDAYYTMPFQHGRYTALIRDERLRFTEDYPISHILSVFPQTIGALPVYDHRAAFIAYAEAYHLTLTQEPDRIVATAPEGGELVAAFDGQRRLKELKGTVGPKKK